MPRKPRIEYPGAVYHVMSRANGKGVIFETDVDRQDTIGEDLRRLGWKPSELSRRAKSDSAKLALAARLRRETTQTLPWVALRLQMGTWKSLNAKLHQWRRTHDNAEK